MPKGRMWENYETRKLVDPEKNYRIREFRGVDGEGGNVAEPGTLFGTRHQYLSLRIGDSLLETGEPLTWEQCFEFICAQPKWRINVSYFFDYDVTMMIRTMPPERAMRLLNRGARTTLEHGIMPLDIGDFECDYLPHKEFKVRRKGTKYWHVISDVGQFFQGPFLATLKKWGIGTEEELEMIRRGKEQRADFTEFSEETRAYNALECLLLEQLMTEFRKVCEETGYVPKKWQGPGYLASAMLTRHNVPKRDDIPILKNPRFVLLAQAAYYGGRFETTATGPIRGPIWQYDINGAYVALLRSLPCLLHGSWKQITVEPEDSESLYFGEVYFNHDGFRYLCNLPFRDKHGNISYPREGNGVYWSTEIAAARRAGTTIEFRNGWLYESHCDCRWFDFVDDYYRQRLALGKTTKGYVLKLAGNSVYGKLAQSIGYAPWANPVWAGLITAGCRALLLDAYSQNPDQCYMLATDGLFMGCPLRLPISKELGEWEETIHEDGMFIVQPGIYFLGTQGEVKTRGVERGRIYDMREAFERQWDRYLESHGEDHTVSVDVVNFITAKQAVSRRKWKIAGTWEKTTRELSFYWGNKRNPSIGFTRDNIFRTVPHHGGADLTSVPYERIIGGEALLAEGQERYLDPGLIEAERVAEQPDWVQPLLGDWNAG